LKSFDPDTFTYAPTEKWTSMEPEERVAAVQVKLNENVAYADIKVQIAEKNGHVIIRIDRSIPANERGLFLLQMERELKQEIDVGITIWLEPVGDKSKLRQLRGVEMGS
jgi:hypothetical protein